MSESSRNSARHTGVITAGPIFVTADEPLIVFESLERAVAYLEWQDVEDGLYRGYDSDGRLIEFATEPIAGLLRDKRTNAVVERAPTHQDELRLTLAQILAMPEGTSLDELKSAAVLRFGLT